ncbi:beta-xylosidase [Sorangium cellulosum]|uniref:Beta-xylosidase n=1 Tax=Sorangium cellulosum TaxID=56 RepID=A0A4V0ND56_SORCE|nr:glycoside hydrolase family 43 protein [Sorangium cellulosum]AUX21502.1 beta-xylosidase [Sorangium cellulosum]
MTDDSTMIENPILRGFHPDPSIVRVGEDYYIATSTFEWFPGVRLHHSRDLRHWRPIGHALDRRSQLDLVGNPRSGGVWAPCLTHADGVFYLVYTDVKTWARGFVDAHNYLVTASRIEGPWSEPVALNRGGFDPSLFHDHDGRAWLVNMVSDHRPGRDPFAGIVLQELDKERRRLVGERRLIFSGSGLGCTEGPHLYRRGEHYYLLVAEGGTAYEHAATLARARRIEGPYEIDPDGPFLTSRHDAGLELQKAGHGCLVETSTGEWYLAHLCGRPLPGERRCILGRETALQRVRWTDGGWLALDGAPGPRAPAVRVRAPRLPAHPFEEPPARDTFDREALGVAYQVLRDVPDERWLSLRERPGFLRLRGRESPHSLHRQSVVGRRVQSLRCRVETCLEFEPTSFQQMAGLMCLYDDENFFYALLSHDERAGRSLALLGSERGKLTWLTDAPLPVAAPRVHLRFELSGKDLRFSCSEDGERFDALGPVLDASILSDERTSVGIGFTGTFAALCAHDLTGAFLHADFDHLDYQELPPER